MPLNKKDNTDLCFIFFGVCALMMFCVLLANSSAGPRTVKEIQTVTVNE